VPHRSVADELVVVLAAQRQIEEAAGRHAVRPVEGAHVGAAQWGVLRDDGFHQVAAQDKVAANAIGFLASGQLDFAP